MSRYLMLIRLDPSTAPVQGPDPALMEDMGKLLEEMTKAGVLLDTAGLRPVEDSVRINLAAGKQTVIDGPFAESKEVIGGYCMVQVKSQAEAIEWGRRFLGIHGPDWTMALEIRELEEPTL